MPQNKVYKIKIPVLSAQNSEVAQVELPMQFKEPVNDDLIKSAFIAYRSTHYSVQGRDPMAGKRAVAKLSRRRRKYKGSYGLGISRVPRKILTKSGTRFNWVGAFSPGTVGGYRAHPIKSSTILEKKINKKEMSKAIRSAISATVVREIVSKRGQRAPKSYPFALESSTEELSKTKNVFLALNTLGFDAELSRVSKVKERAGKGKMRNRRFRRPRGMLIVVSKICPLIKAARNIPGVEVVPVDRLNIGYLAPGANPGRIAIFTQGAISEMQSRKLFLGGSA